MIYIVGHKNPDTDSIVSCLVWQNYKRKIGLKNVLAVRIGELNRETEFVLRFFRVKNLKEIKKVNKKDSLILLDHNLYQQAVEGAKEAEIIEVLDHHYLGDFQTEKPIYYRSEPVGSTSTIIAEIFKERKFKPSRKEAGLLLAGIISDTLNFTSPTTTEIDKKIAKWLNKFAKLNIKKLAEKMFSAKSDISGLSFKEIVNKDYKEFNFKNKKMAIAVWETVKTDSFSGKEKEIFSALKKLKEKNHLDLIFFALVDILKKNAYLYCLTEKEKEIAKKAFLGKEIKNNIFLLEGIVSRKKQMVPKIAAKLER